MNCKLSAGWNSWVAMVEEQREAQEVREGARSVVLHLMNRKLSIGWNAWAAFISERLEALQLVRRCLKFLVNRQLALAFMSWMGAVEEEASNQH